MGCHREKPQFDYRQHWTKPFLSGWTRSLADTGAWAGVGGLVVSGVGVALLAWKGQRLPAFLLAMIAVNLLLRFLYSVSELMVEYRIYPSIPWVALPEVDGPESALAASDRTRERMQLAQVWHGHSWMIYYFYRGMILSRAGRREEALRCYRIVQRTAPTVTGVRLRNQIESLGWDPERLEKADGMSPELNKK